MASDTPSFSTASSCDQTSSDAIQISLDNWKKVGQPALNSLLSSLWKNDTIQDPKMKILVFAVLGGYTSTFTNTVAEGRDMAEAHGCAVNAVMSNPAVSNLVDGVMSDMVQKQVKEMI